MVRKSCVPNLVKIGPYITRISSTGARTLISCSYLGMNWKYACLDIRHRTLDTRHQTSDIGHASGFIFCPMLLYIALDRQQVFVIRHLFLGYRGLSRPASVFSMMMMMMMMMTLHYGFRFRVPVSEFVFRILWNVTSLFQVSVLLSGSTFIHFVVLLLLPVCNLACLSLYYCGGYSFIRV